MARLGLQLYTLRDVVGDNVAGTLEMVAKIGYEGVELAGYYGMDPAELGTLLTGFGLIAAGSHVSYEDLTGDLQGVIAQAGALGCEAVMCPWLPPDVRPDKQGYLRVAEKFNEIGQTCQDAGLKFLYHIHGFEFEPVEDTTGIAMLYERTEPGLVGLEADTYWIERGGMDVLKFMDTYGSRCGYIHFKDAGEKQSWADTEVGAGCLNLTGVMRRAFEQQASWYIVEQEHFERDAMESIAISYQNLRRMRKEVEG